MNSSELQLCDLFAAIAQAPNENTLHQSVTSTLGQYFEANRCKLFFADDFLSPKQKLSAVMKRAISLEHNPVLRYLMQRHTAVHDEIVLPAGMWKTICPRADHGHVMTGPIIYDSKLIGGIAFTRHRNAPSFNAENLADLTALCLHLSSRLAALRNCAGQPQQVKQLQVGKSQIKQPLAQLPREHLSGASTAHVSTKPLTPREYEIADLVAQGLTNKKIGETLWITENSVKQALKRMYRKLNVTSRAQMVSKLSHSA